MGNIKVEVTCPQCGNTRSIWKCNTLKKNHTGLCRNCWDKKRFNGQNHPLWKGGREIAQRKWNAKESSKKLKHKYYLENRGHILQRNREHNLSLKIEVMSHYSKGELKCAHCGIDDVFVLTIDHIDGGGTKHKQSLGGSLGKKLYSWLKNSGYPNGFQVLCFNCNYKKYAYG